MCPHSIYPSTACLRSVNDLIQIDTIYHLGRYVILYFII